MFTRSALLLVAAAGVASAELLIQTPASLVECQPALLSWTGGTAPYYLAAIPGGQSSAAALKDFGQQSGNSVTWTVDLAAGQSITLKITDSTGTVNYDDAVTIQAGSSTACLTSGSSSSSASSAASSVAASTVAQVAAASSVASSGASSAASAASSAASSAAGTASSATSAAASKASSASSVAASATSAAASKASGAVSSASSAAAAATSKSAAMGLTPNAILAAAAGVVGFAWL